MVNQDDVFGGNDRHQVYVWLNLVTTIVGTSASLLTILLIQRMKSNTGHVYLIFVMSLYQLMYDVTFFFSNVDCGYYISTVANFFQILGGISGSLVSNWIAFIALYIVWHRQRFDIFGLIKSIQISCFVPGIVAAIVFLWAMVPESKYNARLETISIVYIYNSIRLISIALNFLFVFMTAARTYYRSGSGGTRTEQEIAIRTLSRRMVFYPVIQAIGRSGYTWYEFDYGTAVGEDDANNTEYAALIFLTVITPMVSVGYLLIFVMMQPNAYRQLKQLLSCSPQDKQEPKEPNTMNNNKELNGQRSQDSGTFGNQRDFYAQTNFDPFDPERMTSVSGGVTPHTESRVSMIEWARKSYMMEVINDMRDEDELYELMNADYSQTPRGTFGAGSVRNTIQFQRDSTADHVFSTDNVLHQKRINSQRDDPFRSSEAPEDNSSL